MTSITVVSEDFNPGEFSRLLATDEDIPTTKTDVVVTNGIADVPPSYFDYKEWDHHETDAWLKLMSAVQNVHRVLNRLDESNPPTLETRWTINVMMQRIREGTESLEQYIARNGLWMSRDEWFDCDSEMMPPQWHEDSTEERLEKLASKLQQVITDRASSIVEARQAKENISEAIKAFQFHRLVEGVIDYAMRSAGVKDDTKFFRITSLSQLEAIDHELRLLQERT